MNVLLSVISKEYLRLIAAMSLSCLIISCSSREVLNSGHIYLDAYNVEAEFSESSEKFTISFVIPESEWGFDNREVFVRQILIRDLDSIVSGITKPVEIFRSCKPRECLQQWSYSEKDIKTVLGEPSIVVDLKKKMVNISVKEMVALEGLMQAYDQMNGYDQEYDFYEVMTFLALECLASERNSKNWNYVFGIDTLTSRYGTELGLKENYVRTLSMFINDSICNNKYPR